MIFADLGESVSLNTQYSIAAIGVVRSENERKSRRVAPRTSLLEVVLPTSRSELSGKQHQPHSDSSCISFNKKTLVKLVVKKREEKLMNSPPTDRLF